MVTGTGSGQAHSGPNTPLEMQGQPGERGTMPPGLNLTLTTTSSHLDFRNYSK